MSIFRNDGKATYTSDIVLGRKYRHETTGLTGTAESVHFYKNACERVVLIYLHDGEIKEASFDAVDLVDIETEKPATSPKTGGPARSMPTAR